jgi:tetratricopeptide (TPR) repeat protein
MTFTAEHNNWLAIGEMIRLIQGPTSSYVDHIVKEFHTNLCEDFEKNCMCNRKDCKRVTSSCGLCESCQNWWLTKLKTWHKKGGNPSWSKNCDGAKWYDNHWEVAKYFMPALGNNRDTVKDAESTELASLLNVLEWTKDDVFPGKTRVDVKLVRDLRSDVRNTWAHAPKHEISDQQKEDHFEIAAKFLEDLKKVFPSKRTDIEQSIESLENLKTNGISDLVNSEIQILLLQSNILKGIKIEVHSLSEAEIKERESQLKKLESAMNECLQRMDAFQKRQENIGKQFIDLATEMKSLITIPYNDLREIQETLSKISADIANSQNVSKGAKEEQKPTSRLQEKLPMFTAREDEIQTIISSLQNKKTGIVCLHGGPGFGKTALAVEVSHRLCDDHNTVVIFSDMSTASTIKEVILQLCLDIGINPEDDPKSSLILGLRNIKDKIIIVIDGIDELLAKIDDWYNFIRLLRKSSNQHCQIITTSRTEYEIPDISTVNVPVREMDENSSLELLNALLQKRCPDLDEEFLRKLAQLCGNIPLAMCIAASRVQDFKDPETLLQYLENKPLETLQDSKSNQFVHKAIDMSYEKLTDEQKRSLVRLSVFKGNFSEEAVQAVIEKDDLDTNNILKELVTRSLVTKFSEGRYSIHLLIRHFLTKANDKEKETANNQMVEYYLKLCHTSTIQSYSKDGFKKEKEILKREAHNIENVLTICSSDSGISDVLANSEIYTSSCRFFYNIVKTIISETVLENFLQACADLAQARKEWKNKINFDCMLVDHEGRKSSWKSDVYFQKMMATEKEFREHEKELTEDIVLQAYFFYQLGRYFLNKSKLYKVKGDTHPIEHLDELHSTALYLSKSLRLRQGLPDCPLAKTDVILSLMQLGNLRKCMASLPQDGKERKKCYEKAEKYYEKAIELAENNLGEHELTSACYKVLGDLLIRKNNERAEKYYESARQMREQLNLVTSKEYVLLLNNLGRCLMFMENYPEAHEILEEALKLVKDDGPPDCKEKIEQSLRDLEQRIQKRGKDFAREALKINQKNNNASKRMKFIFKKNS